MSKKQVKTVINFVLDASGSMGGCRDDTVEAVNEYLATCKGEESLKDALFCMTLFNSFGVRTIHDCEKLASVSKFSNIIYCPEGDTPLLDAVADSINTVSSNLGNHEGECRIVTVVLTDGQENVSAKYTKETLAELIKRKEAQGNWTFVFLGANQDAWCEAAQLGYTQGNVGEWANDAIAVALKDVGRATVYYARSSCMATATFLQKAA